MKRQDYRKKMQQKNHNKLVAKAMLLATIGVTTAIVGEKVEASEWVANTVESIQIKDGDTTYTIKYGDTLWAISEKSGITIPTLQKLNDIANADLIYAGNMMALDENGVKILDKNGNVLAEQELSVEDKTGITNKKKENATGNTTSNGKNNANSGNTTGVSTKPVTPTPEKPNGEKPPTPEKTGTEKPENAEEVTVTILHLLKRFGTEEGGIPHYEEIVAKKGDKIVVDTTQFDNFEPIEAVEPIIAEDGLEVKITYKKIEMEDITVTINHVDEEGNKLADSTVEIHKEASIMKVMPIEIKGYVPVLDEPFEMPVYGDFVVGGLEASVDIVYRKVDSTIPAEKKGFVEINYLSEDGHKIADTKVYEGVIGEEFLIFAKEISGYVLADEPEFSGVYTKETQTYTFIYEEGQVIQNVDVAISHVTTDGEFLDGSVQTVKKGETVTANAKTFSGYHLVGNSTQSVVATNGASITFVYKKDAPVVQDVTVTVLHQGSDGAELDSSTIVAREGETVTANAQTFAGYTLSGSSSQSIVANHGATITFNYIKDAVTPPNDFGGRPTAGSELAEGDWNGVWYDSTMGNSGITFATQEDADNWGMYNAENGWWTWEVRIKGTNEIRVTVDFY